MFTRLDEWSGRAAAAGGVLLLDLRAVRHTGVVLLHADEVWDGAAHPTVHLLTQLVARLAQA